MSKFRSWFNQNSERDDLVSAYRERLVYLFAIAFLIILFPVMIFNLRRGQPILAAGVGCLLIIFILNIAAIRYQKGLATAKMLFIVGLSALVGIALSSRGIHGTYWTFPVVVFICFSVSHRQARIYTALFFAYISALSFYLLDFSLALRALFGLFVTILFMHIFLGIIEKLQEELVEQSLRDPLTGTFNRRQMRPSLEIALERKRRSQTPASILIIDIDDFKCINDNFGHAAGDHVLQEFASLVGQRIRRLDQLFRIGGEEFMLLLPDTSAKSALVVAEEIRTLISKADFIEGCPVTVSIGLSELGVDENIDEWMKHADNALYTAKSNGRDQVFARSMPTASEPSTPEKFRPEIKNGFHGTCPG
jgi:diguanylate cyclase (GGDEF)-like protein